MKSVGNLITIQSLCEDPKQDMMTVEGCDNKTQIIPTKVFVVVVVVVLVIPAIEGHSGVDLPRFSKSHDPGLT